MQQQVRGAWESLLLKTWIAFAVPSLTCAMIACDLSPSSADQYESAVVGGQPEQGYLAVGSLTDSHWSTPFCAATLIAPRAVVTAGHCVYHNSYLPTVHFPQQSATVERIVIHPQYVPLYSGLPGNDVAVLVLSIPVTAMRPMTVASAQAGMTARYVGYGRSTPGGGYEQYEGHSGERKGADQKVITVGNTTIDATGIDGGLCWGDSGGPLLEKGGNKVFGVLSGFPPGQPLDCQVGDSMRFTRLESYRDFLDQTLDSISQASQASQDGGAPTITMAAIPTIAPPGGTYLTPQLVTLATSEVAAEIFYTTNGTLPTGTGTSDTRYTGPFEVTTDTTVIAFTRVTDKRDSDPIVATYAIRSNVTLFAPVIAPSGGEYSSAVAVSLSANPADATICYTTDGNVPTCDPSKPIYDMCTGTSTRFVDSRVVLSKNTTVRAIACKTGQGWSAEASASYIFR